MQLRVVCQMLRFTQVESISLQETIEILIENTEPF